MATENTKSEANETPTNFIRDAIIQDLNSGRFKKVVTRFPPEPNGHLHIGHAKALHIDYGMAKEFKGQFNLRFDDTNPSKEEDEYVQAIIEDVKWLGCDFGTALYFASDYFEKMYEWAIMLIKAGKAYVCDLNADQMREYRGTLTEPGRKSPNRNRSVEENLDLFERMRKGRISGRFAYAARENRHGIAEYQPSRPGHVPHYQCAAPPSGRQMVHLSHVRLGARTGRFHRKHFPFALFA